MFVERVLYDGQWADFEATSTVMVVFVVVFFCPNTSRQDCIREAAC